MTGWKKVWDDLFGSLGWESSPLPRTGGAPMRATGILNTVAGGVKRVAMAPGVLVGAGDAVESKNECEHGDCPGLDRLRPIIVSGSHRESS